MSQSVHLHTPLHNNSAFVGELSFRICPLWYMYTIEESWQKANRGMGDWKEENEQLVVKISILKIGGDHFHWIHSGGIQYWNDRTIDGSIGIIQYESPPAVAAERIKLYISYSLTWMLPLHRVTLFFWFSLNASILY